MVTQSSSKCVKWGRPWALVGRIVLVFLLFACHNSDMAKKKTAALKEIRTIADQINHDFKTIREEVKKLADQTAFLYRPENRKAAAGLARPETYRLSSAGVFYKPEDDGGSAVFVSGFIPVDQRIREIVYFTAPLDPLFKDISTRFPEAAQSYYNDRNSYNRIYPFFDVLIQYEAGMDIPSFNFYYLADAAHNPKRKAVWVNTPYVDPAGRGWMVSAIAPVYVDERLEGVCGIDVTVDEITNRYIPQRRKNLFIVDGKGEIVSIHEQLNTLFCLPPLTNHKYIDTITTDTYRPDDYNLLTNKVKPVRQMARQLIREGKTEHRLDLDGDTHLILAAPIPELDWRIIKVVE